MTSDKWILDEAGTPVKATLHEWAAWFQKSPNRIVKKEHIGESQVSTIFLGIDHNYADGPPLLWETMVFSGKFDQEQDRCGGNRSDALAMHDRMAAKVKGQQ